MCNDTAGVNRKQLGNEISKSSASAELNELLLETDDESLLQGNFSAVPNPTVLRKTGSEQVPREYLHGNIMQKSHVLKGNDEKTKRPLHTGFRVRSLHNIK